MFEVFTDTGAISLSSSQYPLRLIKSFQMSVVTNRMTQGGAQAFYIDPAPNGYVFNENHLVFIKHSVAAAYSVIWFSGNPNLSNFSPYPYGSALWVGSDTPGTVSVYVCQLMTGAEAPPVPYGLEIYDQNGFRTFSSSTWLIPFIRVTNPLNAPTGTLPSFNCAFGNTIDVHYAYFDNPFLLKWGQGCQVSGNTFKCIFLGHVHYGGPAFIYKQDRFDPSTPTVPMAFIDVTKLPIPYN